MKKIYSLICAAFICFTTNAQTYQWAKPIGSTTNDYGYSTAIDPAGNVYVTGAYSGTADFDPGPVIANLSAAGNVDLFIAKYDGNGNFIWAKSIGSTTAEVGYDIAVDASGNVYVTGYFYGTVDFDPGPGIANLTTEGSGDIFFAKYDGNGNYVWAKNIGSTSMDIGNSITVDAGGNVYITGKFQGTTDFNPAPGPGPGPTFLTSAGSYDIFFAKYNSNGDYIWAKRTGGTNIDEGNDIKVDATGNVYITGCFSSSADFDPGPGTVNLFSAGSWDIFYAKYNNFGDYVWANDIGSTSDDIGHSIAVDATGNVYITGYFSGVANFSQIGPAVNLGSISGNSDIFVAKYDSNGEYLWANSLGSSTFLDFGYDIALDAGGNVYITGCFGATGDFDPGPGTVNLTAVGGQDIFFAKYSSTGNYVWAKGIGSSGADEGHSIAVNTGGIVYINGFFGGTADFDPGPGTANLTCAGNIDIFFAKYSPCVPPSMPGPISGNTVLCSGSNYTYSVTNDPTATSYSWIFPAGWSGTSTTNTINAMPGASGNITVTANTCSSSVQQTLNVTVNICTGLSSAVYQVGEMKIYPNPFSNKLTIITNGVRQDVQIFNTLGSLIYKTKIENEKTEIDLSNQSSGIYFIRIGSVTKKIIKE